MHSWDARRARWLLAALAALVVAAPAPVAANHGGREIGSFLACDRPVEPPRCTSVGDSVIHTVYLDASLPEELRAALRTVMAEVYDPTDLIVREDTTLRPSTDVIVLAADAGENGAAAWVHCPPGAPQGINPSGHRWCRHQELHFNLNARYAIFFADDASRIHIACHELGHTIGLHHWGNPPQSEGPAGTTCMNVNTPDGPMMLNRLDIDHINAYPYRTRRPARAFTPGTAGEAAPARPALVGLLGGS